MSQHHHTPLAPAGAGLTRKLPWIGGAVVALAIAAGLAYWSTRPVKPPRFNEPVEKIARFVTSKDLFTLPVEQQKLYLNWLDEHDNELEAAWETGKLSDPEYKSAIEHAWFGPQLTEMDRYYMLPTEPERVAMLDRILDERELDKDKKRQKKTGTAGTTAAKDPSLSRPKPKRDEFAEQVIPQQWPLEDRLKWLRYREALRQREAARDKAAKIANKATTQQSAPRP